MGEEGRQGYPFPSSGGYSPSELGALPTSVCDPGVSECRPRRLQDPSGSLWAGVT